MCYWSQTATAIKSRLCIYCDRPKIRLGMNIDIGGLLKQISIDTFTSRELVVNLQYKKAFIIQPKGN